MTARYPLRAAARASGPVPAITGALVTGVLVTLALTGGRIGDVDIDQLLLSGGAVATTLGTVLVTLVRVLRDGERDVTPVTDPRGPDGQPLVPAAVSVLDVLGQVLAQLQALQPDAAPQADPPPTQPLLRGPRPGPYPAGAPTRLDRGRHAQP